MDVEKNTVTEETRESFANLTEEELKQIIESDTTTDETETQETQEGSEANTETTDGQETSEQSDPYANLTPEEIRAKLETAEKRLRDKDSYIGKLAALKKAREEQLDLLQKKFNEDDLYDPEKRKEYDEHIYKQKATEEAIKAGEKEVANLEYQQKIANEIPDLADILTEVTDLVEANPAIDAVTKLKFKADPYSVVTNDNDFQALKTFANQARLAKKVKEYEAKLNAKDTGELDKLEKKNAATRSTTSAPGSTKTTKKVDLSNKRVCDMTDEELEELKKLE